MKLPTMSFFARVRVSPCATAQSNSIMMDTTQLNDESSEENDGR